MRIKKYPIKETVDKLVYGNGIVDEIVLLAVAEVPYAQIYSGPHGYMAKNDVKVVIDKETVSVDVTVKVHYTQSVSEMAFKIQEAVKHNVEAMTDYRVNAVNVIVKGVLFDDVAVNGNGESDKNGNLQEGEKSETPTVADDKNGGEDK
ncbi:MAG: Asp23/Gls24 family envelope stress response protein [Clostridia bacterium]|nr:Asp23/Gls24 family envelope stress response protein [Clostridia bacterium]